jgi:hypothetical protein
MSVAASTWLTVSSGMRPIGLTLKRRSPRARQGVSYTCILTIRPRSTLKASPHGRMLARHFGMRLSHSAPHIHHRSNYRGCRRTIVLAHFDDFHRFRRRGTWHGIRTARQEIAINLKARSSIGTPSQKTADFPVWLSPCPTRQIQPHLFPPRPLTPSGKTRTGWLW